MPSNPLSTCQPTNFLNRKIDEKPHGWKITDMSETMQIKRLNAFKSTRRHSAIILLPQKCCYYDPALLALVSFPGVMIYFSLSAPDSSLLILSASSSPGYAMFVIPHNNNTQPGSEHCEEEKSSTFDLGHYTREFKLCFEGLESDSGDVQLCCE